MKSARSRRPTVHAPNSPSAAGKPCALSQTARQVSHTFRSELDPLAPSSSRKAAAFDRLAAFCASTGSVSQNRSCRVHLPRRVHSKTRPAAAEMPPHVPPLQLWREEQGVRSACLGSCDVTIRVSDSLKTADDTFRVNVVPVQARVFLPLVLKNNL